MQLWYDFCGYIRNEREGGCNPQPALPKKSGIGAPISMASKILARFALLVCSAYPTIAGTFEFIPINTYDVDAKISTDGLVFYFVDTSADTAEITVEAIQNGKPISVTQVIDTDRIHGERLVLNILIDGTHRHELVRMRIVIGGYAYTFNQPKSGMQYDLTPPRRKRMTIAP